MLRREGISSVRSAGNSKTVSPIDPAEGGIGGRGGGAHPSGFLEAMSPKSSCGTSLLRGSSTQSQGYELLCLIAGL